MCVSEGGFHEVPKGQENIISVLRIVTEVPGCTGPGQLEC